MPQSFKALVLTQEDKKTVHEFRQITVEDLPAGDVVVDISHSSLNYKDGLAITGQGRIIRDFPFVPGIDLAGTVASSESEQFKPGDAVVLTGWGVGERHWGGYAQKARVKSEWLTPLPQGLSAEQAMAVGTAGLTAMLCVMALREHGVRPDGGPVLVTGSAGGVGSVAVALLAGMGYEVAALTGRLSESDYLQGLGAAQVIDREQLSRECKPLESEQWNGAVDTVGGQPLATLLSQLRYGTAVAACGLAAGPSLPTTVFPFILRNIALLGVDSVQCPRPRREDAWKTIAANLPKEKLDAITRVIDFAQLPEEAATILKGGVRGRTVVKLT